MTGRRGHRDEGVAPTGGGHRDEGVAPTGGAFAGYHLLNAHHSTDQGATASMAMSMRTSSPT
jgi:hypothetical protein